MSDIKTIMDTIERAVDNLNNSSTKKQNIIYQQIMHKLKRLHTQRDKIDNSFINLNLINEVQILVEQLMLDKQFKDEIKSFARAYDDVAGLNRKYFASFGELPGAVKTKLEIVKKTAVESAVNNLAETGLQVGVTNGIRKIMQTNITGGGSYAQLTDELRDYIKGTPEKTGAVERYVRTYATTGINQFSAEYNKAIADDLGLEWYTYEGSLLETSRPFCIKAVAKQYIHISEFPALLNGNFGKDGTVPIYQKTGLPEGMMEGTDPGNFPRRRGGWNCGHQLIAIDETSVPDDIIKHVHATQAYKTWKLNQPQKVTPPPPPAAPVVPPAAPPAPAPFTPVVISAMDKKRPKLPKKPTPAAAPVSTDPHVVAIVEKNKAGIKKMEKAGVVFYPEMAKHWPAEIDISFVKTKGSYYQNYGKKIVIANTDRASNPYYQKKIMLHEGGHATHFHKKIITDSHVDPVYQKFHDELKAIISGKEYDLHKLLDKERDALVDKLEFDKVKDIPIKNLLEEIGVLRDTLGGLTNGKFGGGHSVQYYRSGNNSMMEVFAHAVTLAELGSSLIGKDPMIKALVEKMVKYGSQWLK